MAEVGRQTVGERKRDTNNFVNVKQQRKKNTSATAQVLRVSGCVDTKPGAAMEHDRVVPCLCSRGALELT